MKAVEKAEPKKEVEGAVAVKKVKKEKSEAPKKAPVAAVEVVAPQPWMVDLRVGTIIDG